MASFLDTLKKLVLAAGTKAVNTVNAPFDRIAAEANRINASIPKNQPTAQRALDALPQVTRAVANNLYKDVPVAHQITSYVGNRIAAPAAEIPKSVVELKNIPDLIKKKKYAEAGMTTVNPVLNTAYTVGNLVNPIGTQVANMPFAGLDTIKAMIEAKRKKQSLTSAAGKGFTGEHTIGLGTALTDNPDVANKINMAEQVAGLAIPAYHGIRGILSKGKPQGEMATAESSVEIPGAGKKKYVPPEINTEEVQPRQFNKAAYKVGKKGQKALDQVQAETAQQVENITGKRLTHKEVMAGVNEGTPVLKKPITEKQTKAYEQQFQRTQEVLADMSKKGKVTPEFRDLFTKVQTHKTHAGRVLEFQKNPVNPKAPGDPFMTQVFTQLKQKLGDNFEQVWEKSKNVNFKNEEEARNFYREFVKPNLGDWNSKLRYSSMLSSPATSITNIESNTAGTGLLAPVEKTVLGGVDWLSNKVLKTERQNFAGEGVEYAKGYWNLKNIKKAADAFVTSMKTSKPGAGEVYTPKLTKAGTPGRVVENVFDFFPKFLKAQDDFFQSLTEGGLERSNALKIKKGVEMGDPALSGYNEARKRLFNAQFGLKEEGHVLKAIEYIPKKIQEARQSNNPIVSTVANLTFPFVRIPANILKQGIEYSPFGVSTMLGASNKKEQLAKAIIGSTVFTMTSLLASSDRITWAEPTNEAQRTAFRAAGLQPYSVKIGDKWVSYSKLHPVLGMNMALAAAIKDAYDKGTIDQSDADKILGGAAKWLNFFADQSYVKNMGDLVAAGKGDTYGVSKFLSNYPLQEIPFRAFFSWINRAVDPYYRDTAGGGEGLVKQLDGAMKQAMAQMPGLSDKLPRVKDAMGNPIERTPGSMGPVPNNIFNMLSPYQVKQEQPARKEEWDTMQNRLKQERDEKAAIKSVTKGAGSEAGVVQAAAPQGQTGDKILEILLKQQQQAEKTKTITDILTRQGKYKDVPNTPDRTNQLLKLNNVGAGDVTAAKMEMLKKLDTKATIDYIKSTPGLSMTDLFKNGVLTTNVAREMERQGYIQDADALMKKMKATDVYYQRSQARKLKSSFTKKMASLQKKTMKSILSRRSKTFKIKTTKMPKIKALKSPKTSYKLPSTRIK